TPTTRRPACCTVRSASRSSGRSTPTRTRSTSGWMAPCTTDEGRTMSDNDRLDGGASHETDRLTENQPPREDLIPVDDLEELAEEGDLEADDRFSEDDAALPRPTTEDLPESQGEDVSLGDKISEDYA